MGLRPQTIGPYALDRRLGAGGMGEVYRAFDERLDRWVAIKLIRSEAAENATARERFRREARAAASLSHPSIVQIHDIVSSDEGDAIVMELVEGESLSSRLARGPCPVEEAVRLGREIASGLAAAHARGIVHRDLKPENVMITGEGYAKILDFGLAKRLEGEASLTEDHRVIGTFRAMSPEQARGLPVSPSSDLFSLGTLLYEMLSGKSPFEGGSTLETLTRICTHQQAPLREVSPAVPESLSNLVDLLLKKDPALRPESAGKVESVLRGLDSHLRFSVEEAVTLDFPRVSAAVAVSREEARAAPRPPARRYLLVAAALAAVALLAALWLLRAGRAEPLYIAVPEPEVTRGRGDERVALTETALRASVLDSLLSLESVFPLAPDQVDEASGTLPQIARTLAAGELITSRLSCGAEVCEVVLSRVRGADGGLLWTQTLQAPLERPDLLAEAVRGNLFKAYGDRRVRGRVPRLEVRPADYTEYLRLVRGFDSGEEEEVPVDRILARLQEIRSGSPRFLDAYTFEAETLEYRFRTRRDPADLERGFKVLEEAGELSPGDPRPILGRISLALTGGQLDRAEEAIRALEKLQPGDARVLARRARLMDRRGDTAEAVKLMETAARQLPLWKHLFWAADMNYRLGRVAVAREHLEMLLKRSPGHYVGQSKLAEIELMNGSPRRAAELYSDLVRRSPQFGELTNLGLAWSLLGRYGEAEERYREALALAPESPLALLNLADVTLFQGKRTQAESLYLKLLEVSEKDPAALSDIQILSARAQAQAHLGRSGEALQALQAALRLAPENPQTAYEAAVIYSVLGDRASARFHAERALDHGYEPRWFSFPWFEPLRSLPEFRRRLD